MKKKLLMILLTGSLLGNILQPTVSLSASTQTAPTETATVFLPSDADYEKGTVLVTIASQKKTSLAKKGVTSFDDDIRVEDSLCIRDASVLAHTKTQEAFLEDKDLYISKVSSDNYTTKELVQTLSNKAYVVSVEPNYTQYLCTTSDPFAAKQWHLDGDSELGVSPGISYSFVKAESSSNTPVIAVMDTGIDTSHEDLSGHIWQNTTSVLPGLNGYNFVAKNADCEDDNGHGTHCAGTIAAVSENGIGIAGISDAQLMSLKVFNSEGSTDNATIIEALNYLLQAKLGGVPVVAVNCSWGGGTSSTTMASLVKELGSLGVTFVFASGNDSYNHDMNHGAICPYDMYDMQSSLRDYLIITGSSDSNDNRSGFSDYGSQDVDLFAPGEEILSTYHETTYLPGFYDTETEQELTLRYLPLDSLAETESLHTDEQLDLSTRINANLEYQSDADYQSKKTSGGLCWTMDFGSLSNRRKSTYIYLDVTDAGLNPEDTHYVSLFMGYENDYGSISWEHVVKKSTGQYGSETNRFYTAPNGRTYIKIIGIEADGQATGSAEYYLDNIGISTANPNPATLGKYELMSGTSMAAPMVSGAIGLLASLYPSDDAYNRKQRLITCSRKSETLRSLCVSGGILDLSSLDNYTPKTQPAASQTVESSNALLGTQATDTSSSQAVTTEKIFVKKVRIQAAKKVLRSGKKLSLRAVLTPSYATNKKVRWKSSNKKWATVTQKGKVKAKKKGIGHTVTITATAKDGSKKNAKIKIRIKK